MAGLVVGLVVGCSSGDGPSSEVADRGAAPRIETRVEVDVPVPLGDGEGAITGMGEDDVWVSSFENGRQHALRVDTDTNDVTVEPLALKHFSPVAATADGVWFMGRGGLAHLDSDTLEASRPVGLPVAPTDASFDPASGNLWLAGYHAEIVSVELQGAGPTTPRGS